MTFRDGAVTFERLTLWQKFFRFNWGLALLILAVSAVGFLMLFSVAGGDVDPWASRQMTRFGVGFAVMMVVAMVDLRYWKLLSPVVYFGAIGLLIAVEFLGVTGMGAQRWIDLGFFRLQPSELMKVALILALARYYSWLPPDRTSKIVWMAPPLIMMAVPVLLVLRQPDLGTALLLMIGGLGVMFLAGVSWWFFVAGGIAHLYRRLVHNFLCQVARQLFNYLLWRTSRTQGLLCSLNLTVAQTLNRRSIGKQQIGIFAAAITLQKIIDTLFDYFCRLVDFGLAQSNIVINDFT